MISKVYSGSLGNAGSNTKVYNTNYQIGLLAIGQSNLVGSPTGTVTPPAPYNVAINGVELRSAAGAWGTLIHPSNNLGALGGTNFGPELSLGAALQTRYGRHIYSVKIAKTGASMFSDPTNPHFNIDSAGADPLYPTVLANAQALLARINATGKIPKILLIIVQGERDCLNSTTAAAHKSNTLAFVNKLISDGIPIFKVIIDINDPTQTAGSPTDLATVIAGKNSMIAENPGFFFGFSCAGVPREADNIHYTGPGHITNGLSIDNIIGTQIFTTNETISGAYSVKAKQRIIQYNNLSIGWKDLLAQFIDGCDSDGILDAIGTAQFRFMDNEGNTLVDMNGYCTAINQGGVHTPKVGMTYNGTTYLNTNYDCAIDGRGIYTLNDAFFAWFVGNNLSVNTAQLGGVTGSGAVRNYLGQEGAPATQLAYRINSTTAKAYTPRHTFTNNLLYAVARLNANSVLLNENGVNIDTGTTISSSIPGGPMFEGGNDNLGVIGGQISARIDACIAGKGTTMDFAKLNTRLIAFKTGAALL